MRSEGKHLLGRNVLQCGRHMLIILRKLLNTSSGPIICLPYDGLKYSSQRLVYIYQSAREDEEEGVSSYWMTLRKRQDTGN
jgi:hypothetical protein